jgi:pimeloyl-ACP methyl ester carboxylesterase
MNQPLGLLSVVILSSVMAVALAGCTGVRDDEYSSPQRLAHGMVIILPGIEGESPLNRDIQKGLEEAGLPYALPIYRWGRPIPIAGPLINQVDVVGNRLEARKLAYYIEQYQDQYPSRPVFLVGHSGGGGVAVFTAENLADGHKLDGLVLLSASISRDYDLAEALEHSRHGLINFYSKKDVGFLIIGTTVAGNVDGGHGPAAGALGFQVPGPEAGTEIRQCYQKLYQHQMDQESFFNAHSAATGRDFIRLRVAPWLRAHSWPPLEE